MFLTTGSGCILLVRSCDDNWPVHAFTWKLTLAADGGSSVRYLVFAYDEVESMDYFGDRLAPYWRHIFQGSPSRMLESAHANYFQTRSACTKFDNDLVTKLTTSGTPVGSTYATLCALAYRQTTGAMTVVWNSQYDTPWVFMKEISSDGDVSTVDVIYPASPFFLALAPETLRKLLIPILEYANNATSIQYNLTWAPNHLGTWPICDLIPSKQEQMPMEETGNLLVMLAAIAQRQDKQVDYLKPYIKLLHIWGRFLNSTLPDPGNQVPNSA